MNGAVSTNRKTRSTDTAYQSADMVGDAFAFVTACLACAQVGLFIADADIVLWPVMMTTTGITVGFSLRDHLKWTSTYAVFLYGPIAATASAAADVFSNFVIAFLVAPLIFVFLIVLDEGKCIKYDMHNISWPLSRMIAYATLRSVSAFFVTIGMPAEIDSLIGFLAAFVESTAMLLGQPSSYYTFHKRSRMFVQYTIVKSSVFLLLPILEDSLLTIV